MDSQVPSDADIQEVFGDCSKFAVKGGSPDMYLLGGNTLRDLKDFIDSTGTNLLFIEKTFIDLEKLKIRDDMYAGIPLEILGGVQFDSHIFNRDIGSVDVSSPAELRLFVIYEGKEFGVRFVDPQLDAVRAISPQERVASFTEARRAKMLSQTKMSVQKEDSYLEKFADLLIQDRLYRELRDDNERLNYVMKIARRVGNDELRKAVLNPEGTNFSMERMRRVVSITIRKTDLSKNELKQMVFEKGE